MEGSKGPTLEELAQRLEQAEAERRLWEERYRLLAETATEVISCIDADGKVVYVSPSVRTMLGYEPEDLIGKSGFDFIEPDDRAARRAGFERGLREGYAPAVTTRVRRKDGTYVWVEYVTHIVRGATGKVTGFKSTSRDVTDRHQAEEALQRAEASFRAFVEQIPEAIVVHDHGTVRLVNSAFARMIGVDREELVGRQVIDMVPPEERGLAQKRVESPPHERAGIVSPESHVVRADGERVPIEVIAVPATYEGGILSVALLRDLRERKRFEAQLMTADRMASLGQLSAAVGHEINNPLMYVLGSLALMREELAALAREAPGGALQRMEELLANARDGTERVRAIVRDLRALSRGEEDTRGPVDLVRVLDLSAAMAGHEIRHRARLVKAYAQLPQVHGNEARLGQVFLNLLVNAAQAIRGDAQDNEIRITARAESDEPGEATGAARWVAVEVSDTGVGVPAELRGRIFEPFFTSKEGQGTGLGLSISHHIVTSLGGTISVAANTPRGTRFRVMLRTSQEADAPAARPPVRAPARARILVVDDEPHLAKLVASLLSEHEVTTVFNGADALARIRAGERFDLVVCDLHMDDVTGMDVYERIKVEAPGLERQMLFMTGGAVGERARNFVARSGCPVLDKPFDPRALAALVADLLGRDR